MNCMFSPLIYQPLHHYSDLHTFSLFRPLTSVRRSPDGSTLFVCSIDGYVSTISLSGKDTGAPLPVEDK